jgi:DNA-binding NtrC family response regulator
MDIFVVDDEPVIAGTTAAILKVNGYAATPFTNPYDALAALKTERPRLLIADVKMPGLSGLDLAIQARDRRVGCETILFTALNFLPDPVKAALKQGVVYSVLFKPVTPDELLQAVDEVLNAQVLKRA